jgi:transcriptional regulator with XRE-family HTH domain
MTIKIFQMRAARALLNWSQKDVAERAGLSELSITKFENEKSKPHQNSLEKIVQAFSLAGVVFTENGVDLKNDSTSVIEGDEWYSRLLEDVYHTLLAQDKKEFLCLCTDDKVSPPIINEKIRKIRGAGIAMRQLVEEGNTYLMGPLNEYRYIPKEKFKNYVTLIYGDKVAVCTEKNTKAIVFVDAHLSKTWTNVFEVLWASLKQPKISTADEKF